MGAATVLVALYAADHYQGWELLARWTQGWRLLAVLSGSAFFSLAVFTLWEMLLGNEVYVLDFKTDRLEWRHVSPRGSKLLGSWPMTSFRRFSLELPEEEARDDNLACLYLTLSDGQQIRLLEASYSRDFVQQVERRLAELCGVR